MDNNQQQEPKVKTLSNNLHTNPQNSGSETQATQPENSSAKHTELSGEYYEKFFKKTSLPSAKILKILAGTVVLLVLVLVGLYIYKKYRGGIGSITSSRGEVVWWNPWVDEKALLPIIDEFEKENPDVKIKFVKQSPQDYRERLKNALLREDGPDMFSVHNSWIKDFQPSLAPANSTFSKAVDLSKDYYPVILRDLKMGNDFLAIPLEYDALTLYVNEDIFAAAGRTYPKTWDQVRQVAKDLTTVGPQKVIIQSGIAMGRTDNVDYWQNIVGLIMTQNGADLSKPTTQQAANALEFYTAISFTDKVWDEKLPPSTEAFARGKLAMLVAPASAADEIKKINPNLNFRTVFLPQVRQDDPEQQALSYASYWAEGVWSRSGKKTAAYNFLTYLSNKDVMEKLYKNVRQDGMVGYPFPRVDMNDLQINDRILGSIIALAPNSRSWYLADKTYDGDTGINTLTAKPYAVAIKYILGGATAQASLKALNDSLTPVLLNYNQPVK